MGKGNIEKVDGSNPKPGEIDPEQLAEILQKIEKITLPCDTKHSEEEEEESPLFDEGDMVTVVMSDGEKIEGKFVGMSDSVVFVETEVQVVACFSPYSMGKDKS